ncbi:MAG: hypothetical protein PHE43_03650 [Candidatus Nanoarchaeia archaeon]|nr:hypothetical protein [Candidatus Nanoarchaeia archaeon]
MIDKEIKKLTEYGQKQFSEPEDYTKFGLDEIEHHVPELRNLHAKKDPHLHAELADVYIWARMLLEINSVDERIVRQRIERFKEKINKALEE